MRVETKLIKDPPSWWKLLKEDSPDVRQAWLRNDKGCQPDAGFRYVGWKSSTVLDGHPPQLQFQDQLLHPVLRGLNEPNFKLLFLSVNLVDSRKWRTNK